MDLHEVLGWHGDRVPIRMGVSVRGLSPDDDAVMVAFGDGSARRYDLVIGADGIHSMIRELTFGTGGVRPVGRLAGRFVTACPPEVTTWTVLLGRRATFLVAPIGRGQAYCYCDTPIPNTRRPVGGDVRGRLADLLLGFADPVPGNPRHPRPGGRARRPH